MRKRPCIELLPTEPCQVTALPFAGFTLLELSIVLTIIGLIVGGVLVGVDLINAAAVRAQVSQIERFQTAVMTFRIKFGYLPGDIPDPTASSFGFMARGTHEGEGDGNEILEGFNSVSPSGYCMSSGELVMFWADLALAQLIPGTFPDSYTTWFGQTIDATQMLPHAKIGRNNYVSVYSLAPTWYVLPTIPGNYFTIASNPAIAVAGAGGGLYDTPNLTPIEAMSIDSKVDDGLPQSGRVIAIYDDDWILWAAGGGHYGANGYGVDSPWGWQAGGPPTTSATPAASYTCYDNANGSTAEQYSVGTNSGNGQNCALSFQFQ